MEGNWTERLGQAVDFIRDHFEESLYVLILIFIVIALLWYTGRPLKTRGIGVGSMNPVEEKRINRLIGNYLTDALLQGVIDEELTNEQADIIGTRVGRILGIPGLLHRKIVEGKGLKEELKEKHPEFPKKVVKLKGFDRFLKA
jgi:hypothetical protein